MVRCCHNVTWSITAFSYSRPWTGGSVTLSKVKWPMNRQWSLHDTDHLKIIIIIIMDSRSLGGWLPPVRDELIRLERVMKIIKINHFFLVIFLQLNLYSHLFFLLPLIIEDFCLYILEAINFFIIILIKLYN